MRRFGLNFALLLGAVILLSASAALLASGGLAAPAILVCIALAVAAVTLRGLVGRLVGIMTSFYSALEMGDTSVKIRVGGHDRRLRRMSESANRVMDRYRANCLELETRKLYYDRILQVMTHEMRNAITPVIALSSDMTAHPDRYRGAELTEALEIIRGESAGIKRFLDAYYSLTHLPEPERRPVEAADFLAGIKARMEHELTARGMLGDAVTYSAPVDMTLDIDSGLMRQAVVNLLRNSLDAVAEAEFPWVRVAVSVSEGHPFLTVADNGCGIPASVMPDMFQPFFSTKKEGSGIGLFLSRQIARLHGGELTLTSQEGKGSTVTMTLP